MGVEHRQPLELGSKRVERANVAGVEGKLNPAN